MNHGRACSHSVFRVLAKALTGSAWIVACAALVACNDAPTALRTDPVAVKSESTKTVVATSLGAAIAANAIPVPLSEIAKSPGQYRGKDVVTTGTVTAVCQHRGCWMNLKSDDGEAFVRMAGHAFAIPRDAIGKRARIKGTLHDDGVPEQTCSGEKHAGGGCKAEAEDSLGKPLAKLELEATGVELY